ncbi:putative glycosyl transferase, ALG6/ALG8 [Plasmopara halstedii]
MCADTKSSLLHRGLQFLEKNDERRTGTWLMWLFVVLTRWLVGLHSYSGERKPPMFGDYEAQRHWMEITTNLPLSDWYFNTTSNDLMYWGLDYPPLTAYVSYLFGRAAEVFEPAMVELASSQGYESATSKVFMRTSVILCDVALFIPAISYLARVIYGSKQWMQRSAFFLLILLEPAILLIDHGHFQYNNVSLGFTALSVALIVEGHEFLGSICYCLALNFKQMALYYSPAFGIFLFVRCLYRKMCVLHLAKLVIAVIITFALMWAPFCAYPSAMETCWSSLTQVASRNFPFNRGLFEDKVANFWCIADFIFKIRRHVTPAVQMPPTSLRFVLSLAICSLSFYLFSFQVHEKSILLPLLPMSFLFAHNALLSGWFSVVSTFSMYFLLKKDGLAIPYIVLQVAFAGIAVSPFLLSGASKHLHAQQSSCAPGFKHDGNVNPYLQAYVSLSLLGIASIHAAQALITPPPRYPHIHDYVFAAYSCGHFLLVLVYLTYWQWTAETQSVKAKTE